MINKRTVDPSWLISAKVFEVPWGIANFGVAMIKYREKLRNAPRLAQAYRGFIIREEFNEALEF